MSKKTSTLKRQFLTRIIGILLAVSILAGGIQLYLMKNQLNYEIETQTGLISQSINQGIKETDLASKSIEHQIDLKMVGYLKHIEYVLNTSKVADITQETLLKVKEELNLAGISIMARKDNDIVVVKSTDPNEIGWSSRKSDEWIYEGFVNLFKGQEVGIPGIFSGKGYAILPMVQSEVYEEQGYFFKYGYYHAEGTDYIINPFIEANEVYKFTESVGPESWINEMEKENSFVKDISILNPEVFQNPDLENQFYPPVKKVVYGDYKYQSEKDLNLIKGMIEKPIKHSSIEKIEGEKILKLFLPQENGHVLHIVLDYQKMTAPLNRQLFILILTGLVSLVSLFLLTYRLFNSIYSNIQKIIEQIRLFEKGDLTIKSQIPNGGELESLSITTNIMVDNLNKLIKGIQEQANKTQLLSEQLEVEASNSVEKIYEISTETTIKAREQLFEITEFLDNLEKILKPHKEDVKIKEILESTNSMRKIAQERTAATTNTTITLSDLLKSLHGQSSELSDISKTLLEQMSKFKL